MEIFGWFCLLVIAILFSIGYIAGICVQAAFAGITRSDIIGYILTSVIPATLWYAVIVNFPFMVAVR